MPSVEVSEQENLTLWRIPELGLELELPLTLIADVVAAVKEGFNRFPRGGLEVGGVLFGRREGERIRVLAARSIPCKYLQGPSFALTAEEHEELAALLVQARHVPELAGLIPVGWYHSHTRGGLLYTDADAHLHNRHFPQPWQLGLLLRPEAGKPTQFGVFVRARDGELPLRPALVLDEESLPADGGPRNGPPQEQSGPKSDEGQQPGQTPPEQRRPAVRWAAPGIALALLAGGAYAWRALSQVDGGLYWERIIRYWRPPAAQSEQRPFQLAVSAEGSRLIVEWNPAAPAVAVAREVKLLVGDGDEQRELPLDAAAIARGSMVLERSSDHVKVTLTALAGPGGPLRETVYVVGAPPPPSGDAAERIRLPALLEEKNRLETALEVQRAEADTLAEQRALLEKLLQSRPPREPPAAAKPRPEVTAKAPESAPAPVVLEQRPAAISSLPAAGAGPSGPGAAAPKPATAPSAGRLVWTGALGPGRVLTISGRQASLGSFTGQLPGVPVRIQVFPAELSSAGLVVYTSNPKHGGAGLVEAPGPANAWTRTLYRYAPERADGLQLLQAPAASNGWVGLTLRANANTTAIVVDWETLR